LIERGMAYEVDGNVFFSVRNFKGYGKLSKKNIEELESGARVDVDESKRDPLDFALWKKAKPGEPTWPSPWGEGRPGWHIECSAMSAKYLGQPFDIHGGGRDLIFPHHENEIAQAEGATGKHFVKYWLHNGFININAEKMSKSLGNITTISKVLEQYDAEAVKLFLLSNQYRSPIDYTKTAMEEAQSSLDRFYETAARLGAVHPGKTVNEKPDDFDEARDFKKALESFESSFREDMNDDFNTARAVALAFDIVRLANRYLDKIDGKNTPFTGWSVLQFMSIQELLGETLGIFGSSPDEYRRRSITRQSLARGINVTEVKRLIEERREARLSKNFAESDRIRKELSEMGVEIKDLPDGKTDWKIK